MTTDEYPIKQDPPPVVPVDPPAADLAASSVAAWARKPPPRISPIQPRREASDFWMLFGCNAIVFASSVCIMVLELTASRLIAGHLGQSLYTWTSVIGVILAGISLGNYLGGYLADRYPPAKVLGWLFAISGLFTFSVLWVNQWVAAVSQPEWLPWQGWVIAVVSLIFLVPALALGTISPVTASLALSRSKKTGSTVGNIYAWGAMGSIVGTFLAGFVLIDLLGTKMIIVLTASALLLMGTIVAAGQWTFRAAIVLGAMQFVAFVGSCAALDSGKTAVIARYYGRTLYWLTSEPQSPVTDKSWENWGAGIGRHLHDLGLALWLRKDSPTEYNDESNYFAINVSDGLHDGERVRELRLDHLLHSYFNLDQPSKLYYDYERVYAAVTERVAASWDRQSKTLVKRLPDLGDAADSGQAPTISQLLPPRVTYDQQSRELAVAGAMDLDQFRVLTSIGPYTDFWQAMLQIWQKSNSDPGGFITVPLDKLPPGVTLPENSPGHLHFDPILRALLCTGAINFDQAVNVMMQGADAEYLLAVYDLYRESRKVSTMFIGGGGFVFPRWIETTFPHEPLIDVAEIDPAVKLAVQQEMGLPPDEQTLVRTHIGDARKFVDDRRRQNAALHADGQSPVRYDFVYGDAFNDFSVPWHLTTREFTEKVRDLLTPGEGVYLVNIIDIYPRAEYPPESEKAGRGEVHYEGALPQRLFPVELPLKQWVPAASPFATLEVRREAAGEHYQLRYTGVMTLSTRSQLRDIINADPQLDQNQAFSLREAIGELQAATNVRKLYAAELPAALLPAEMDAGTWTEAPAPFQNLQLNRQQEGTLIGYRGVMSDATRQQLLALAPADTEFKAAVDHLQTQSRAERAGAFLGRYVNTVRQVFPCVYVFSGNEDTPGDSRDTFVVACALRPIDFDDLGNSGGHWSGRPFAWSITDAAGKRSDFGQMSALLESSRGLLLTDDFAPVDNLLAPVFVRQ